MHRLPFHLRECVFTAKTMESKLYVKVSRAVHHFYSSVILWGYFLWHPWRCQAMELCLRRWLNVPEFSLVADPVAPQHHAGGWRWHSGSAPPSGAAFKTNPLLRLAFKEHCAFPTWQERPSRNGSRTFPVLIICFSTCGDSWNYLSVVIFLILS